MSGGCAARAPGFRPVIVIPAHDEQADIERVLRGIREHCEFPVVVVDDASSDRTAERARSAGATVLPLPLQLGAWGATQAGMRYALRHGYDCVMTMDADGQHEPVWIQRLMAPVLAAETDVAIGCCPQRGSRLRHVAWRILKRVSGLSLQDITSGFRVYNRDALELLASPRATLLEYQDVGVLSLLHNAGLNTLDVEVTMLPRRSGVSRVYHSWFAVTYYMCHTMLLGLSKRRMRSQGAAPPPTESER
jgi:glycosyltransferase involved in cell wall biosynthesis